MADVLNADFYAMIARTQAKMASAGQTPVTTPYGRPSATRIPPRFIRGRPASTELYRQAWNDISGEVGDVKSSWYTDARGRRRQAGGFVQVRVRVVLEPQFQRYLERLGQAPAAVRKTFRDTLGRVARQEVLPRLKAEIPRSGAPRVHWRRGETIIRKTGRNKHLYRTAKIAATYTDRVTLTVGNDRLFYAAALHAKRPPQGHPFMTEAVRKAWRPFNEKLDREFNDVMRWLARGGRKPW